MVIKNGTGYNIKGSLKYYSVNRVHLEAFPQTCHSVVNA